MRVNAIVLAGAKNNGKLRDASPAEHEALIEIGGRVMVDYVLEALRGCEAVDRLLLVGPEEVRWHITTPNVELIGGGSSMIESMRIGLDHVPSEDKVLLVTGDIPLIKAEAIRDFLQRCHESHADIYYPVITRQVSEGYYPGVRRTYVRLTEGVFTGGNLVLLQPVIVRDCHGLIEQAIEMRKKPLKLAQLLGARCFLKLLVNRLSIKEIEDRVEQVMGFKGLAVITAYPEVGIDVDKPCDLELARRVLS